MHELMLLFNSTAPTFIMLSMLLVMIMLVYLTLVLVVDAKNKTKAAMNRESVDVNDKTEKMDNESSHLLDLMYS